GAPRSIDGADELGRERGSESVALDRRRVIDHHNPEFLRRPSREPIARLAEVNVCEFLFGRTERAAQVSAHTSYEYDRKSAAAPNHERPLKHRSCRTRRALKARKFRMFRE